MSTNAVNHAAASRLKQDADCDDNVIHPTPGLKAIRISRHTVPSAHQLTFGLLNVQSANNKIDDIIDMKKEQGLDVMLLTETWHDTDSVSIRRLRAEGLQVIERSRPRSSATGVNHGGVAIAVSPGVRLSTSDAVNKRSVHTFEYLCVRVVSRDTSCTVLLIYRPGSIAVSDAFFIELSSLLDDLATLAEPAFVAGDLNIRLDRPDDVNARKLSDLFEAHDLMCLVNDPTHDGGGTLDVVAMRNDLAKPEIKVIDVGFSDHRLVRWISDLSKPAPVYTVSTYRPWRRIDVPTFQKALQSSTLCIVNVDDDDAADVEQLAARYDDVINDIADRLVPVKTVTRRSRPHSDPWYDDACRAARRRCRRAERRSSRHPEFADDARAELQSYRSLVRLKRTDFWHHTVEIQRSKPRKMWQSIDKLMGRGHPQTTSDLTADDFHRFFVDKVTRVRDSTADAPDPLNSAVPPDCTLGNFQPFECDDVIRQVMALPDKQCASDPMPTWLLKACASDLAPFLCRLFNASLLEGVLPSTFKSAYVTPILKKTGLAEDDAKSYRPISNLSVASKLLERLVASQLLCYLNSNNLLPELQSAYLANRSTETAMAKVVSDILMAFDRGDIAALALLDCSAAFDTVDHDILLRKLSQSFGVGGTALQWLTSYLRGRRQCVRHGGRQSKHELVEYGVPQGSVLGPLLFIIYTADLCSLVTARNISIHQYADDVQVYGWQSPLSSGTLCDQMSSCVQDICRWMRSHRLQHNTSKTEFIWCCPFRRRQHIPDGDFLDGVDSVKPVSGARDLGVFVDSELSMRSHISHVAASCFGAMRQIRSIRRSLPPAALEMLVTSLVHSRLDYCNVVFAGLPLCDIRRLQSVLNSSIRLVTGARKYDHVTSLLRDHHWLPIAERVEFKLCTLVFRCLQGTAPSYLADHVRLTSSIGRRNGLRSADMLTLDVPRTRLSFGDRAFVVAGPRAWNKLPFHVRSAQSMPTFRKLLKTHLFQCAYL